MHLITAELLQIDQLAATELAVCIRLIIIIIIHEFHRDCTLECPQRRQRRDCRRQRIPNLCRGNGEGAIADGPVQRAWNMQRRRDTLLSREI